MFHSATDNGIPIDLPYTFHGYSFIKMIGSGSTSIVALVQHTKTAKLFTAKIMSKYDLIDSGLLSSIEKEIALLRELDHPNIVKYEESFEFQNAFGDQYIALIMEYCKNGDLLTYSTNYGFQDNAEKAKIINGILKAIQYLHNRGISHGDIKAENILIDNNKNAKLCDFGYSRTSTIGQDEEKSGTLYYAAPEMFRSGEFDTLKTDIWAFGIMIYALFEKKFPYAKGKQKSIIKQIKSGKLLFNQYSDKNIVAFVEKCTQFNPKDRPSIDDIIKDEFFDLTDLKSKQNIDKTSWISSSSDDLLND